MIAPKIESALERAFRDHVADSFAVDAAVISRVLIKQYGDDARRVCELVVSLLGGTAKALEPERPRCHQCGGSGSDPNNDDPCRTDQFVPCPNCGGTGHG